MRKCELMLSFWTRHRMTVENRSEQPSTVILSVGLSSRSGMLPVTTSSVRALSAILRRRSGEHGVGADGARGGAVHHQAGGLGQRPGGVTDIVDQNHILAFHVADDPHAGDLVGDLPLLVANGHVHAEVLGKGVGPLRAARIRRGNQQVVRIHCLEVGQENRRTVEVVDRNLEEALNLVGVKVHGDDPVDAGRGEHVGDELGPDGHPGGVFPVLTRKPEVGDDRDDALRGGPLGSVD